MNVNSFFEHWGILENPFRAEEARQDAVFGRLGPGPTNHPDFDKILGELDLPSTSIVFGEKGSGKTAIRLQIAQRIASQNEAHPDRKTFLIPYDELNPVLDRFCASVGPAPQPKKRRGSRPEQEGGEIVARLRKMRLVDHMDGILHVGVTRLVDGLLHDHRADPGLGLGDHPLRELRRAPASIKRDLLLLGACYDRPDQVAQRTAQLRRRLRAPMDRRRLLWTFLAIAGVILPAGVVFAWFVRSADYPDLPWMVMVLIAFAVWGVLLAKRTLVDPWRHALLARRVARQLRAVHPSAQGLIDALALVPGEARTPDALPVDDSDEHRYAMFARLRRVLVVLGFTGSIVVIDRVDEPTVISGDPDRMQAVVWPLLNNKLLQMERTGFKLLLPIELRHSLFRESTAFFQEARLDKQNLIDRLVWTGATLYDLCNARLAACRRTTGDSITLVDMFEQDVTRQDLVDALDQMRQPRDAFKFLYQCIQEHCSNVTQEQEAWRIPRLVLEQTRRQQSDRVQQLHRGLRPA